jgi:hypothetical protein
LLPGFIFCDNRSWCAFSVTTEVGVHLLSWKPVGI